MKIKTTITFALLFLGLLLFSQSNQEVDISNDILVLDEDIEIEPPILTPQEIENLYLEYRNFSNISDGKSLFPHLKAYFEGMADGLHPFEIFEYTDNTLVELKVDTSDLRIFIEEIKTAFDNENKKMDTMELTKEELIKHVQLAINPAFENWILFKNGTYIILEEVSDERKIELQGMEQMLKYGPVYPGGQAGDFVTISLSNTEGWVISGHGYGMYTYVHPSELEQENPKDFEIGLYGRSKRGLDGANPEIICISAKGKISGK